jgi:hypothetical protein
VEEECWGYVGGEGRVASTRKGGTVLAACPKEKEGMSGGEGVKEGEAGR